jgi:hypothetical protein
MAKSLIEIFSSQMAQQPPVGQGLLIIEASLSTYILISQILYSLHLSNLCRYARHLVGYF